MQTWTLRRFLHTSQSRSKRAGTTPNTCAKRAWMMRLGGDVYQSVKARSRVPTGVETTQLFNCTTSRRIRARLD
jgi:hypothetical protein